MSNNVATLSGMRVFPFDGLYFIYYSIRDRVMHGPRRGPISLRGGGGGGGGLRSIA